ncbi:MAG: LCP family protein [Patescibacteria group bacterium]
MKKELPITEPPSQQPKTQQDSQYSNNLFKLFIKVNLLSLFFASLMLLITALGVGVWGYTKFQKFSQTAGVSFSELKTSFTSGWQQEPLATNGYKNFLLLGVDSLSGRGDVPPLTDTMMLVSLNLDTGKIITLPFPRDLWSEKYKTKINALYYYGFDRYPVNPARFVEETLEELTAVTIHHTIVLSLDQLEELIDLVGGVNLDIPLGFVDEKFPRPGVDVTIERDPKILYQTISFEPGQQTLTGEKALQYIRSRHSEGDAGTDLARGERQQLVIKALFSQLMEPKQYLENPALAGQLYKFYEQNFAEVLPLTELIATGKKLAPIRAEITIAGHQLSTTKDDPKTGVLANPKPSYLYQNQWVYVITDEELFKQEISNLFQ